MPSIKALCSFMACVVTLHTLVRWIPDVNALPFSQQISEDISGSAFLSVIMSSDPSEERQGDDINKKEAPRILPKSDHVAVLSDDVISEESLHHQVPMSRNSRSNKNDVAEVDSNKNTLKAQSDDMLAQSSSYYGGNVEPAKNQFEPSAYEPLPPIDDSPKIIGVRVTSSVAVGRNNKNEATMEPQDEGAGPAQPTARKIKNGSTLNRFLDDNPTTWRPSRLRFFNHDYYRGVPSNRHSISTLPGPLIGANEDYIQQQKQRELNRKKQENLHPYQRSILYNNEAKQGQKPRSYSYSSVINTFGDSKLTTPHDWSSSTRAETVATEASAGYVTIINHNGDNSVDPIKDSQAEENIKHEVKINQPEDISPIVSQLPIVYSEPAKIYSEPSKVYSEPSKIYSKPEKSYSEPSKVYSEPSKVYGEPSKFYSEPSKVYGEPSKVYSEPAKVYGKPSIVYHSLPDAGNVEDLQPTAQPEQKITDTDNNYGERLLNSSERPAANGQQAKQGRLRGTPEQNYEVDESVSVMTNGRTHGVQEKPQDDSQKVGYVVEGRNYRKYRVEERTSDGFIVGEYGVVSHDDGSLRGVRYTADGTTNPRLIYDALMKFLSL